MPFIKYGLLILLASVATGCQNNKPDKNGKPLARANDRYLYISDLKEVIPAGTTGNDSAAIVKNFVERWVRNQLLLGKAEQNLTDAEKNVDQQIENYRSSLLIYAYQQSYLRQKLDTVVSDTEMLGYYNQNRSNFILSEPKMKGMFIKVPATAPDIAKVQLWYCSDDAESIKNLEGYCFKNASIYDHFDEDWVSLNQVLSMMPDNGGNYLSALQYRKCLEVKQKDFVYFLNVKEMIQEGTVSPFELVKNDIHNIILNKRKVRLIEELENNIFSDAQNREYFTIYP
jgi:hypothetical protein